MSNDKILKEFENCESLKNQYVKVFEKDLKLFEDSHNDFFNNIILSFNKLFWLDKLNLMGNDVKYLCSCSDEENKITNKNEYTIVRKLLIKNETTYNHNTVPEDKSKLDITGLDFKVSLKLKIGC